MLANTICLLLSALLIGIPQAVRQPPPPKPGDKTLKLRTDLVVLDALQERREPGVFELSWGPNHGSFSEFLSFVAREAYIPVEGDPRGRKARRLGRNLHQTRLLRALVPHCPRAASTSVR